MGTLILIWLLKQKSYFLFYRGYLEKANADATIERVTRQLDLTVFGSAAPVGTGAGATELWRCSRARVKYAGTSALINKAESRKKQSA
ncbi:MAG: hypothetical protein ETSY1_30030 [Candidatus Entotheonella factor]|uniref:Uncharacterized protein n=1 Tax=Entotheonella factor TaxID=1429438 RepID=W4LCX3_ENTF1|nr:MAG: hypothetical protein ETSY1_30030 [Candidatus Entotheonella factor]